MDANTGLLSDAASKTVSPVTASVPPLRLTPNPSTFTLAPRTVAIDIPGTLVSWSSSLMSRSPLALRFRYLPAAKTCQAPTGSRRPPGEPTLRPRSIPAD